ncbi:PucR family transcriptional regulator [Pseudoclavibacter endophyticus]|uniref:PucR family transcriptional regulator n=1 Tax=Pseudoclavibacter endophyticus TaxID=1778590 RepID=A0A6H9WLG9_9MICO|nr:PucR family transcriptional regulator [Pseudoclavibacter endophyticus]KAB1649983.1 PucR family transcriptional regulator [Pseudoclavibacter endophyticus]GGA58181.1 PucR family transcriptional regulator [Pseudoclavibacter endophyticus]
MPHQRTKQQTLAWLRANTGELATSTSKRLQETLPWYSEMPPGRRSAIGLVAQAGITSFVSSLERGDGDVGDRTSPESKPWIARDVFDAAPRELLRSISLQQTLQLIRVVVSVVEERVADGDGEVREAVLRYSRDVAFAAADVYARAAEARGLWDQRLEALVVDSILTGEHDDELPSRIAALGWHGRGEVAVLVGTTPKMLEADQLRRAARHADVDLLIGVQGNRLVLVIGRAHASDEEATTDAGDAGDARNRGPGDAPSAAPHAEADDRGREELPFLDIAKRLEPFFGEGRLVLGPTVPSVVDSSRSARAALAGFAVAGAWRAADRPVPADDLLPERALAGDPLARQTLVARIFRPLADHQSDLLATLWCYLDNGRSLEGTARELFVHPNTVRYRLKRISELIGWDATGAREALILQCALILGQIADPVPAEPRRSQKRAARSPRR